ncbi:MAG: aminomethyl-transferring glycine dehydrogenase subunit GcvPA [Planctomycetota bacterium]
MNYTSTSPAQQQEMLDTIGISSIDELFAVIPTTSRVQGELDLPPALSELELQREVQSLASSNVGPHTHACFIGGGAYDHFIPAFIDQMITRGEFLTAYTPYQGEASQGSLQAFFEFQTQIARLTGMDIANASLYEGASATAEGVLMAINVTGKTGILVAETLHPDYRKVIETVTADLPVEVMTVPARDGLIDPAEVASLADDRTACLVLQSPNRFGLIEDWSGCFAAAKGREGERAGAEPVAVAVFNPIACALLKSPGDCGADVAAGEGQPLGIPLQLGGPYLGLFAAKDKFTRKMPGRLVGQTVDADGRRVFCLALQTREQHIRGAKATSNVCTNQGLLALRATMFMTAMGREGIRELAEQCWHKAHWLAKEIAALEGYELQHTAAQEGAFFNEFVVRCPVPGERVIRHGKAMGLLPGVALASERLGGEGSTQSLLIAVTEKRTKDEMELLLKCLKEAAKS